MILKLCSFKFIKAPKPMTKALVKCPVRQFHRSPQNLGFLYFLSNYCYGKPILKSKESKEPVEFKKTHEETGSEMEPKEYGDFNDLKEHPKSYSQYDDLAPTVVDSDVVCCQGGSDRGHPREFIRLNYGEISYCMYCMARFTRKDPFNHDDDDKHDHDEDHVGRRKLHIY